MAPWIRECVTGPPRNNTCDSRTSAITRIATSDHSSLHSCKADVGVNHAIQRTASAALPRKPASRNSFGRPQAIATPEISNREKATSLYSLISPFPKPIEGSTNAIKTIRPKKKRQIDLRLPAIGDERPGPIANILALRWSYGFRHIASLAVRQTPCRQAHHQACCPRHNHADSHQRADHP